jgi:hypothetical protein
MSRIESPDMQLIELLRRSDAPSEEDRRRVRNAIGIRLAVGVGASAALLTATHVSWAARLGTLATWGKSLVLVSSLVGVGIGVTWYAKPQALLLAAPEVREHQAQEHQTQPSGATMAPAAASVVREPESTRADSQFEELLPASSDQKQRAGSAKTASHPTSSTLEAEMQLVTRAQKALKSGQPGEALRALDEHARRFPSGVLALERSGVRTVALCQAGRVDEGRTAARSYLRLVPNSMMSKRIRIACRLSDE